jgi:hypothetical protein
MPQHPGPISTKGDSFVYRPSRQSQFYRDRAVSDIPNFSLFPGWERIEFPFLVEITTFHTSTHKTRIFMPLKNTRTH